MAKQETTTVRLTLRTHIAEKLRAMCHARGETASDLIDRWILAHDERGEPCAPKGASANIQRIVNEAFRGLR